MKRNNYQITQLALRYNSLKTIIPTAITQMMEIQHGDTLTWDVEFVNGEKKITVKKL